jgi:hypothetical protein
VGKGEQAELKTYFPSMMQWTALKHNHSSYGVNSYGQRMLLDRQWQLGVPHLEHSLAVVTDEC